MTREGERCCLQKGGKERVGVEGKQFEQKTEKNFQLDSSALRNVGI